ncbi:beta-galactosidase [Candidatus Kaiserbacteria bacterium]|nr:beta-galactosidase [Candidatus Kaiserbacteria bacterium]
MNRLVWLSVVGIVLLGAAYLFLTLRPVPAHVTYGITFSTMQAEQLGLDWKNVYVAMLDDLKVRDIRIPAYWQRVVPKKGRYDWSELDFEMSQAQIRDARVILAVGRRLPRWPECHIPDWARSLSWEEQKEELRGYITAVVQRYKEFPAVAYWQVENEPYLSAFAFEHCGALDEAFLEEEIALVHSLDARPVLVTDSGNLGTWIGPYKNGDAFGTSLYMYFWNPELGQFKTRLPAFVYRMKERAVELLYGPKPTFLIELSLEPWLTGPTAEASLETQLSRMDIDKFDEIVAYARKTSFGTQYLWGVEWWYYMKEKQGHPEFWKAAKELYAAPPAN